MGFVQAQYFHFKRNYTEKSEQIVSSLNQNLPPYGHIGLKFSNSWIHFFKNRSDFKSFKLHGEAGGADQEATETTLPTFQAQSEHYFIYDIWNIDEFGLFYNLPPSASIAPEIISETKRRNQRVSFPAACLACGTEHLLLFAVGRAYNPRCFAGKNIEESGFKYACNKKAWMRMDLFFSGLFEFDNYIGSTAVRRAILCLDNASCIVQATVYPLYQMLM